MLFRCLQQLSIYGEVCGFFGKTYKRYSVSVGPQGGFIGGPSTVPNAARHSVDINGFAAALVGFEAGSGVLGVGFGAGGGFGVEYSYTHPVNGLKAP